MSNKNPLELLPGQVGLRFQGDATQRPDGSWGFRMDLTMNGLYVSTFEHSLDKPGLKSKEAAIEEMKAVIADASQTINEKVFKSTPFTVHDLRGQK